MNSIYNKIVGKVSNINKDGFNKVSVFLGVGSFILFLSGYRTLNYNLMILSCVILIISSILYNNDKNRTSKFLFIMFLLVFIIFLLNMPIIDIISGKEWWLNGYKLGNLNIAISLIYISILSLMIGFHSNKIIFPCKRNISARWKEIKNKILSNEILKRIRPSKKLDKYFNIIYLLFIITYIFSLYVELDKIIFMNGKVYEDFYKIYKPSFPSIVSIVGNLNIYFLILSLALKPRKTIVFATLTANIIKTLPLLIIGKRGPFILSLLFSVVYYLIRDRDINRTEHFFGKKEKALVVIAIPTIVVLMTLINYTRSGFQTHGIKIFEYSLDFFYRQGFTFKVHTLGVENVEAIASISTSKNYILGEILDVINFGKLSQILFGAPSMPLGNSIFAATHSNNYAYALSYLVHPKYLDGHGYGSSYILEAFQTYGQIGVVIIGVSLGKLIRKLSSWFNHGILQMFISLMILEKLFFIPRAAISSMFSFIIKPSFFAFLLILLISVKTVDKISEREGKL